VTVCGQYVETTYVLNSSTNLHGQAGALQVGKSVAKSGQYLPPLSGAGLVQDLFLFWTPPSPQVTEQGPSLVHSVHPPSTVKRDNSFL
jgi:hypothetical protein